MEELRDELAQDTPVWAVFGDLMAGLVGIFVLILVWVLGYQVELAQTLREETGKRQQEEQRRMALEQALAGPLAAGRITLRDGRVGWAQRGSCVTVNTRLDNSSSFARGSPTMRGSSQDSPYSAGRFSLPCAVVSLAPGTAKRMSQNSARASPTPAAGPFSAPMTGLRKPKCQAKLASNSGATPYPGRASSVGVPGSYPPFRT